MWWSSSSASTATAAMSRSWIKDRPASGYGSLRTSPVRNSSAHPCAFTANPLGPQERPVLPVFRSNSSTSPHTPPRRRVQRRQIDHPPAAAPATIAPAPSALERRPQQERRVHLRRSPSYGGWIVEIALDQFDVRRAARPAPAYGPGRGRSRPRHAGQRPHDGRRVRWLQ